VRLSFSSVLQFEFLIYLGFFGSSPTANSPKERKQTLPSGMTLLSSVPVPQVFFLVILFFFFSTTNHKEHDSSQATDVQRIDHLAHKFLERRCLTQLILPSQRVFFLPLTRGLNALHPKCFPHSFFTPDQSSSPKFFPFITKSNSL